MADSWCAKAYKLLPEIVEVPELATLLDGGFPAGVEDIDSLPDLIRHQRISKPEITKRVLERYRDFAIEQAPTTVEEKHEIDAKIKSMQDLIKRTSR